MHDERVLDVLRVDVHPAGQDQVRCVTPTVGLPTDPRCASHSGVEIIKNPFPLLPA